MMQLTARANVVNILEGKMFQHGEKRIVVLEITALKVYHLGNRGYWPWHKLQQFPVTKAVWSVS